MGIDYRNGRYYCRRNINKSTKSLKSAETYRSQENAQTVIDIKKWTGRAVPKKIED